MIPPLFLRMSVLLSGTTFLVFAFGFHGRMQWAMSFWPSASYLGESGFSSLFVGAILAAIGAGAVYAAWLGDMRAATGGALALLVATAGMAVSTAVYLAASPSPDLRIHVVAFAAIALLAGLLLIASLRLPQVDRRPIPRLVRIAFWIFSALLVITGTMLVMRTAGVFPWPLQPLSSVLYGCMFLGFAANYGYAALWGKMADAKVSLLGFLVYDAVLIVPFIRHFAVVADEYRFSLAFYTAVLVFSA
ncbi:MAG TPA: hypothetical protein VFK86_20655, partial [Bauldia sp.]|nr:hypothetical protein [Bauldia sp.]